MTDEKIGAALYDLARELFPIHRSLTGDGVRQTLGIIQRELPDLKIHEVPSGTECFDWVVPLEWNIEEAYILSPGGEKIVDFERNNLEVAAYSEPVSLRLSLKELQEHLYSLPDQPQAIPYVTSFYQKGWGFCLTHSQRLALEAGEYTVFIDSSLEAGHLTYADLVIPGESEEEVLLSTYVCHPSLANNETSGPVVTTFLAKWLKGLARRRYTYRIVFIPETIGSLCYLSRHLDHLKRCTIAGFNVTCVGDERTYSYLPSRTGDTLADQVALHVLKHIYPQFKGYTFLDRGGDERQYCSPGVDLPLVCLMRSKYHEYPEYHTSEDDLDLISPEGLFGGYEALRLCLLCLERNELLKVTVLGEPHLGKRGLYPTVTDKSVARNEDLNRLLNLIAYCDGKRRLLQIAETINEPMWELFDLVARLKAEGLLKVCDPD
ncbi:MAG: DUF4910 domain-containing protein [Deltaproteobacteria bacterium]|nr:DUF4910 domain-containing protein [Deltaproteobacteria bacterium]